MRTGTAALFVVLTAVSVSAADVSGSWEVPAGLLNDVNHARVTLTVSGERLTGTLNELKLEGTVKGDELLKSWIPSCTWWPRSARTCSRN